MHGREKDKLSLIRCSICKMALSKDYQLKNHLKTYHKDKGDINFICSVKLCNKGFYTEGAFKIHQKNFDNDQSKTINSY